MSFEDDLAAAAETKTADAEVLINGTLYTFRFLQLSGIDWATEADKHPARPGVLIDMRYGYNIRTLCLAVAKISGRRVEDDGTLATLDPAKWNALFRDLAGSPVQRLCDTIWALNEGQPEADVEAAKKLRADRASALSSTLPSDLGSPLDASGVGNRAARRATGTTRKAASSSRSRPTNPSSTESSEIS